MLISKYLGIVLYLVFFTSPKGHPVVRTWDSNFEISALDLGKGEWDLWDGKSYLLLNTYLVSVYSSFNWWIVESLEYWVWDFRLQLILSSFLPLVLLFLSTIFPFLSSLCFLPSLFYINFVFLAKSFCITCSFPPNVSNHLSFIEGSCHVCA